MNTARFGFNESLANIDTPPGGEIDLESLEISTRLNNFLKHGLKMFYLEELLWWTDEEIKGINGYQHSFLNEIRSILNDRSYNDKLTEKIFSVVTSEILNAKCEVYYNESSSIVRKQEEDYLCTEYYIEFENPKGNSKEKTKCARLYIYESKDKKKKLNNLIEIEYRGRAYLMQEKGHNIDDVIQKLKDIGKNKSENNLDIPIKDLNLNAEEKNFLLLISKKKKIRNINTLFDLKFTSEEELKGMDGFKEEYLKQLHYIVDKPSKMSDKDMRNFDKLDKKS